MAVRRDITDLEIRILACRSPQHELVHAAGLEELSRRNEATLFMTLLAAFDVLLLRSTGQSDLSVGTPVANRGDPFHVNAALISKYVVNVFPRSFTTR